MNNIFYLLIAVTAIVLTGCSSNHFYLYDNCGNRLGPFPVEDKKKITIAKQEYILNKEPDQEIVRKMYLNEVKKVNKAIPEIKYGGLILPSLSYEDITFPTFFAYLLSIQKKWDPDKKVKFIFQPDNEKPDQTYNIIFKEDGVFFPIGKGYEFDDPENKYYIKRFGSKIDLMEATASMKLQKNATIRNILFYFLQQFDYTFKQEGDCIYIYRGQQVYPICMQPLASNVQRDFEVKTFYSIIDQADRVVIRPEIRKYSFKSLLPIYETKNMQEIKSLNDNLKFAKGKWGNVCCGIGPVIEWYKGNQIICSSYAKLYNMLSWQGFPSEALLTNASSKWLCNWLAERGAPTLEKSRKHAIARKKAYLKACEILPLYTPRKYINALKQAEKDAKEKSKDTPLDEFDLRKKLMIDYVRIAFPNIPAMYQALFKLLGCLSMTWNGAYFDGQNEARNIITNAPQTELDKAFTIASKSKDKMVHRGAEFAIFGQHYLKDNKTTRKWIELFVKDAYDNPFTLNRRMVLYRLVKHPKVKADSVLQKAVSDPDQTVRRYAIMALWVRNTPFAQKILEQIATGKIEIRKSKPEPFDEGLAGMKWYAEGAKSLEFKTTDKDSAKKALKEKFHGLKESSMIPGFPKQVFVD